jgi:hypothetical protein
VLVLSLAGLVAATSEDFLQIPITYSLSPVPYHLPGKESPLSANSRQQTFDFGNSPATTLAFWQCPGN